MTISRLLLLSCAAVLYHASLTAGDRADSSSTLAVFLAQAMKANPGVQAAWTRARGAETRVTQAGAWDDPQAGVEFFATPVTSANPFRDGLETDYFLQQMIPLFGKKGLMSDAASAGARMAEQSAVAAERDLRAAVKTSYAMIFAAQRRIDVNTENERLLVQIVETARAKYSVGLVNQGDLLKAQVELARLHNDRAGLQQDLVKGTAMMNALRGLPADAPIGRVADVPLAKVTTPSDSLTSRALENRPELRGMRFGLEMNRADLAAAERERLPDLMVRGMYKRMMEGTDQWAAMFSINLPFAPWAGGKTSGRVEENALAARATEQSLADMTNMIRAEVREKWGKVASTWEQIDRFHQLILPQADQSLQSTLTAYQTDRATFLSLLDSYRMVQMLKMDYYMLVGDYAAQLAQLERALGEDLP
jgi:cobalt-zinc-cadmium efflux system outer membrane protein